MMPSSRYIVLRDYFQCNITHSDGIATCITATTQSNVQGLENEIREEEGDVKGSNSTRPLISNSRKRMIRHLEYSPAPQPCNQKIVERREDALSPDLSVLVKKSREKGSYDTICTQHTYTRQIADDLVTRLEEHETVEKSQLPSLRSPLSSVDGFQASRKRVRSNSISETEISSMDDDPHHDLRCYQRLDMMWNHDISDPEVSVESDRSRKRKRSPSCSRSRSRSRSRWRSRNKKLKKDDSCTTLYSCMTGYCDWTGPLEEWKESHIHECRFILVGCPRCGDPMERGKRDEHDQVCRQYPVRCDLCGVETVRKCLDDHLEMHCEAVVIECDGCKQEVKRPDIHLHTQQCPEAIVICEYARYGCEARRLKRKDLEDHMQENTQQHLKMLDASHGRLKRKVSALHKELKAVKDIVGPLQEIVYSQYDTDCKESN